MNLYTTITDRILKQLDAGVDAVNAAVVQLDGQGGKIHGDAIKCFQRQAGKPHPERISSHALPAIASRLPAGTALNDMLQLYGWG